MSRKIKYPHLKDLYYTDRNAYYREWRKLNPRYLQIKDEWRKLDENIYDKLPDDVVPIDNFPTYYARPNGEVWRDTRGKESAIKCGKERVLKLTATYNMHNNYWLVQPYKKNGKKTAIHLHKLILTTFKGPAPEIGMECHHIDANTSNNSIDNLMWVTRQQNIDFVSNPGRKKGIPNKQSKWIKYNGVVAKLWLSGIRPVDIASMLNIPDYTVHYLVKKLKITQQDINNL
jgi:hypothetical protein